MDENLIIKKSSRKMKSFALAAILAVMALGQEVTTNTTTTTTTPTEEEIDTMIDNAPDGMLISTMEDEPTED